MRLDLIPWLYPALEVLHVMGIALLFGGLVLFELRLLGLAGGLDLRALARLNLRAALAGFALCAATGLAMFAGQAEELLLNPAFRYKLALIALAGLNAAAFHARRGLARPDRWARLQGLLSLGLWGAVIICGRWIAYA